MKTQQDNNSLTIFLEGKIDSTNALAYEEEISAHLAPFHGEKIYLSCEKLEYVTSAGLRIFLGLWKKHPNLSIVEVVPAVYEIFEMTGFTRMLDIHKALRRIDITGASVIGEGFTATVYRIDADTIVKVFKGARSMDKIQAEIDAAKQAFIYGIPTAISFDIVRVGDHLGVVFEMLDCASLRDLILQNPDKFDEYKKMYADLSYKITHTEAADSGLAECKQPLMEKLSILSTVLTEAEYTKLMGMIDALPNKTTLTHGDFHIKNILVQNGEPILIDMDAVSLGHPIFELEGIYLSAKAYNQAEPDNASKFFGVSQQVIDDLYDALLARYFPDKKEEDLQRICDKIALLSTAHLAYQTIHYKRDVNGRLEKALATLRDLLNRYDDLEILD
ncbi:MAG: phosphotransferase [Bacilli bacterium]|nr:phosphotransferase [Bacilli bacterium]